MSSLTFTSLESQIDSSAQHDTNKHIDAVFIAALFNLDTSNIQSMYCINDPKAGLVNVHITLIPAYPDCPCCGDSPHIKDYRIRKINHSALNNLKLNILYRERWY